MMHISQLIKQFNDVSKTELSFHLPNKYRLLGDYTFENKGSSIYWPFDDHCIAVVKRSRGRLQVFNFQRDSP